MPCSNCNCPFYEIQVEEGPLSAAEVSCLVTSSVQKVEFTNDEVLFMQGQVSSNLYSLNDGLVKICTHTPDGREQIVGLSVPGKPAARTAIPQRRALRLYGNSGQQRDGLQNQPQEPARLRAGQG